MVTGTYTNFESGIGACHPLKTKKRTAPQRGAVRFFQSKVILSTVSLSKRLITSTMSLTAFS